MATRGKARLCGFRLWVVRHWRLLVPRRNPLARRFDHIEATVLAVAIGLLVAAVPIGVSAGSTVDRHGLAAAHEQLAQRHESTAITRAAAPPEAVGATNPGAGTSTPVAVTWKAADGGDRSGTLAVAPATPAGSAVPIWLDSGGNLTTAPASGADIANMSVGAGILTWAGITTMVLAGACLARVLLDRRRFAAWADEWERFARRASRSE